MGKALKWLFGLVALLVVVVIAAIVILPMVIDPNDYKDEIIAQVKSSTGRDLAIRDPLELSVFPKIAVRLGGVSLSNAPGFGSEPFAEVEELDLRVAFMPILSGSLEVDTVVLRGMALNLARDKSGRSNWDDLTEGQEAAGPRDDDDAGDEGRGDVSVAVQGVIIDDANLVWDDQEAGTRYEISDLNVETGSIGSGKAVPVEMSVTLTSSKPAQTFGITLGAEMTANGDMTRFDIDDLKATLDANGEGLPAGGVDLTLTAAIAYDSGAGTVAIDDLKLSGAGVELSGALNGRNLNGKPDFSGQLSLAESNLRQLMALGGTAPETADPNVLTRVSADFGIAASSTRAALKPFKVKLDDSTFSGDFEVTSFEGPGLRFALNLDAIDLDRYLPPPAEEDAAPAPAAEAGGPTDDDPLAALRTLDMDGSVKVGSVKLAKLTTTDVNVGIKSSGGVLRVSPIAAKLYEGALDGSISVDARQKTPKIAVKQALTGIQAGPLLADLADKAMITGTGQVKLDISMSGLDGTSAKETLNGSASFLFRDGAYKGLDVIGTICSVGGKIDQLLTGGAKGIAADGETKFAEMGGSATFTNGVMVNEDMEIKSPLIRVNGAGKIDLPGDSLDYLTRAELVTACEGQGGAGADRLVGVPLPIRASGSLTEPRFAPDWAALGKEMATSGLKDKAKGLIGDKLKIPGLSGGAAAGAEGATEGAAEGAANPVEDIGGALKDGLKKLF